MISEKEKAERGAATLRLFCQQFGNDVYGRIFLEVLFEILLTLPREAIEDHTNQQSD